MYEGMLAETVGFKGHNGDAIEGYLARPLGAGPYSGVIVIHHLPGWDEATKEMTRKLAYHGYAAFSHHLHHREGSPEEGYSMKKSRDSLRPGQKIGTIG